MLKLTRPVVAILASALLGITLAACGGAGGGTIVTVNGQPITKAELDAKLEASAAGKQTLNQLVQAKLIDQYAADNKLDVSDAEVQKKEDEIKARYQGDQFAQILKQQGLTEDDVKKILKQQVELEKAVGKNATVSDADIKAYFDKNHATLDKPEQVRARHILVADLKTASDVEAQLKKGAKFEDLAQKYSTDPSSKVKGGELGFFGHGQMVPAFDKAAFTQPIASVGPPVKSPFGYHIIQVEERKPALKATLASSKEQIKTQLTQQQLSAQIPTFLQGLRAKAKFDVKDQRFADVFATPTPAASAAASAAAPAASPAAAPSKK